MIMSKPTSSNVANRPPQHKVFINFRRKELGGRFVSHLERALARENINVFIDNHERMGKDLSVFFTRIEESRIAIAVISSLYTESIWCLDELAKIKECVEEGTLEVFPVFYKVSPDTIKRRRGMFGDNFRDLVKRDHIKGRIWRKAIKFVTNKKGETVEETSDEVEIIDKIVKDVKIKLDEISMEQEIKSPKATIIESPKGNLGREQDSSSSVASPLFGIETRLDQLKEKLGFDSEDVTRFVGVVGMPGIGKTTLAKRMFEDCGYKFLHTMFLDDVREKSKSLGFHRLQEDLLYGLKRSKYDGKVEKDTEFQLEYLKAELSESRVFIVLDDVNEKTQIDMILGGRKWLKQGSKVIITSSSKSSVKGMVDETYLVPGLSDNDALKYFEKHAFSSGSCDPSFVKLAREVIDYSRGNPLALKVLGGELLRKDEAHWRSKLGTLASSPISNTIQNVLRIPYDDLSEHRKDLFLDVACFFRFEDEYHVRSLMDSPANENVSEIKNLADKFLIDICGGRLEMNDLMYTFAMGLESQSSPKVSTSGRRLFNHCEIITILLNNAEATKVRGIFLDMSEVPRKMSLSSDTFKEMKDLRYLKLFNSSCAKECEVDNKLNFPDGLEFTMQEVRYLHWLKFPLKSLPRGFNPKNLIDLKLPYSQIEQVWEGQKDTSKLMWVDLNHSSKLSTLSGLSLARKLESMNLEGCTELETVHEELQNMENLVFLNLRGCTRLESLPKMNLTSLKTLILSGCSNLDEFNLISESLEELYLDGTAIKELPSTIGELQRLVLLTLEDCEKLLSLPDTIANLKALRKLVLSGCSSLSSFPEVKEGFKHLNTLLLDGTSITELPDLLHRFNDNKDQISSWSRYNFREWPHGFYGLSSVQRLSLRENGLKSLPCSISYLYNLKWLDLKHCERLVSIPMLPPNLVLLDAHGCVSLEKIETSCALMSSAAREHSHSTFVFTNCCKLDQVAKSGIISYVRKKIMLLSDALTHQDKGSMLDVLIKISFPGWHLPVWFNYRSVGQEIQQKLPRHWNEDGLIGIALCAVVSFKEKDESLIKFSCILGEHGSDKPPRDTMKSSGHVFIGYISLLHLKNREKQAKCVATEASFKFKVNKEGTKEITNCEVLKCGFTLIYAPTKRVHSLCAEAHDDYKEKMSKSRSDIGGIVVKKIDHILRKAVSMSSETKEEVKCLIASKNVEDIQCEAQKVAVSTSSKSRVSPEISDSTNNGGSLSRGSLEEGEVVNKSPPKFVKASKNVEDIQCEAQKVAVSTSSKSEVSPKISDSANNGGSLSTHPGSVEEGEVVNEPKKDEINQKVLEPISCLSTDDTEIIDNDQSLKKGANSLCERFEKPIRLICLVISIYAGAAFLLGRDHNNNNNNKKRWK